MIPADRIIPALAPYEWHPLIMLVCLAALLLYWRGRSEGARPGAAHDVAFVSGVLLVYLVTQTQFDYFAQFVFFIHRGQHLVLHHLAAMLIALANPWPVLAKGLPARWRRVLAPFWQSRPVQTVYAFLQYPPVAGFLFVGLIYFWLLPDIHFTAMLSSFWYQVMNWSMLIDGLLFWWLIFNPAPPAQGGLGYGKRCLLLALTAFPQIILGAYIALGDSGLYAIYELCGRPWPISAGMDQTLGGLITWIPGAMMGALGVVVVLVQWNRHERRLSDGKQGRASIP